VSISKHWKTRALTLDSIISGHSNEGSELVCVDGGVGLRYQVERPLSGAFWKREYMQCTWHYRKHNTVNSAYNGSAYKELSVIRNWFSFLDLYPSLFYVKNMDIADSVVRNYRLEGTHFPIPMLINQSKFRSLSRNPLLVRFAPCRLITRKLTRTVSMLLQTV